MKRWPLVHSFLRCFSILRLSVASAGESARSVLYSWQPFEIQTRPLSSHRVREGFQLKQSETVIKGLTSNSTISPLLINRWIAENFCWTFFAKLLTDSKSPVSHFSKKTFPFVSVSSMKLSTDFLDASGFLTPWNINLINIVRIYHEMSQNV